MTSMTFAEELTLAASGLIPTFGTLDFLPQ